MQLSQVSSDQNCGWLGCIGIITKHYIRIPIYPYFPNHYFMEAFTKNGWCKLLPIRERKTTPVDRTVVFSRKRLEDRFVTGKLDGPALMSLVAQKLHEAKISTAHLCYWALPKPVIFFFFCKNSSMAEKSTGMFFSGK